MGLSPDQIGDLAKQGPAWVLLLVAVGAIVYLYKGRLADWGEIKELAKNITATLRDWIGANDARTRAIESNARAQELAAAAVGQLTVEVNRLSERIDELAHSNRSVREALLSKGLNL